MLETIYYYVSPSNPYQILSTEIIDELATLIYEGKADFILPGQITELKLPLNYLENVKRDLSSYFGRVPLYDINSNSIYLIYWENIFPRIFTDNYRFIDKQFLDDLKQLEQLGQLTLNDRENLRILSHYDLETLRQTYLQIFYDSFVVNSYITHCRRPSFSSGMEHIAPYYNINEINYLAYDWKLSDKIIVDQSEINHLCKKVAQFDIPAQVLLDHQLYIYNAKAIGLVKHYSLFGSYYMNLYLRKFECCLPNIHVNQYDIRNVNLEKQIVTMIKLIQNAPAFSKNYTVYRFVERDDYLRHLKVGEIYQDPSFMSTTRNPFYYKENYAFGYILIKITLPKNIKGIGLCIESYSNFPNEEEIILPPTSKYRLDQITDTSSNTNFHGAFDLQVHKKYEFTWVGNDYLNNSEIKLQMDEATIPEIQIVNLFDLLHNDNIKYMNISERLDYFRKQYTNENNQFCSIVGNHQYTFTFEAYDSSSVYKPFFYYEVRDGIMITTTNPKYGNINIMMELGPEIHINYYFRYSVTDPSIVVDLSRSEWIEWLSLFAYVIGSRTVIFHSNYSLRYDPKDNIEIKLMKTRYTFSQNIYLYMKENKKLFDFIEIVPHFDYEQFDLLKTINIFDIIKSYDKNELFKIAQNSGLEKMYDYYLYIVENYPKLIKVIEEKMQSIYEPENNPFLNMEYSLDAWSYLYSHDYIKHIPSEKEFIVRKGSFKKLIGNKKIPKFKNRLRSYLLTKKID